MIRNQLCGEITLISTEKTPDPDRAKRILVVEDVPSNSDMLASFLIYSGYQVDIAANGRDALERLDTADYDACLMDIQMPIMRGDEAIRRIRSSAAAYRDLPILALTADASQRSRDNILAQGASAFFAKPFELAAILAKLEHLTESYRSGRSADERRSA